MKAIVIGTSLSGKTTVIRDLRNVTDIPISEMDEELTRMNGGEYPSDSNYKNNVLAPKIIEKILNKENALFFTNTDYFDEEDLRKAREKGFEIIQIEVSHEELLKRNTSRVEKEGYLDSSEWLKGMLEYQKNIREKGLIDKTIDGELPTSEIVEQLRETLGF